MTEKLTKGLMEALCKWQAKKPQIDLDGSNPHFKSKYATLSNIINKVKPALEDCGLTFTQIVSDGKIITMLLHPESEGYLISERPLPDFGKVQDEGSFITYQKRYQLCAMLGVAGEDDNDGNGVESKKTESKPRASVAQINNAINHQEKGMIAGNKQALDTMIGKYTLDATQVRQLVYGEIQMFEDSTKEIISLLEVMGYVITKAE
jgi:hypothetical protein